MYYMGARILHAREEALLRVHTLAYRDLLAVDILSVVRSETGAMRYRAVYCGSLFCSHDSVVGNAATNTLQVGVTIACGEVARRPRQRVGRGAERRATQAVVGGGRRTACVGGRCAPRLGVDAPRRRQRLGARAERATAVPSPRDRRRVGRRAATEKVIDEARRTEVRERNCAGIGAALLRDKHSSLIVLLAEMELGHIL